MTRGGTGKSLEVWERKKMAEKKKCGCCMQAEASGKMGRKELIGGCKLWFKHSEPKNILMENLAPNRKLSVLKRCNYRKLVQVGAEVWGNSKISSPKNRLN